MAPLASCIENRDVGPVGFISAQWTNPSDILSVLLLLGPDMVKKAIAQLAGRTITPIAFSFGWVGYAAKVLLSAFGRGLLDNLRLMPDTDLAGTLIISALSGQCMTTKNWILGRLLRDEDDRFERERSLEQNRSGEWVALSITIYKWDDNPLLTPGVPKMDWVWYSGIVMILVQLAVSAIPWILRGDWGVFLIASTGSLLAVTGASLPQWRQEKWGCPKTGGATIALTQGNGNQNVTVILGSRGFGLDLETLAQGIDTGAPTVFTKVISVILALCWVALLIVVGGMKENTWYILGIGFLGSMQNLYAAGTARHPSALGIHLKRVETIRAGKVAAALKQLEEKYPLVGTSLAPIFFPGSLRVKGDDLKFWHSALQARMAPNKFGTRLDAISTFVGIESVGEYKAPA
ncbi:hypothetical protein DL767_005171 [Monosporascus sp. MG133]|nr:hypothetical protein DL767_005171 [Monosporascus sp. MG133]